MAKKNIQKGPLGKEPTKKQKQLFEKFIKNPNFVERWLISQSFANSGLKILDFCPQNKNLWFVVLDKMYFLYNKTTDKLLYYGMLFEPTDPPTINSSKEVPWMEIAPEMDPSLWLNDIPFQEEPTIKSDGSISKRIEKAKKIVEKEKAKKSAAQKYLEMKAQMKKQLI